MKVIVINGAPRAGKSTFVQFCKEIDPDSVLEISTVDYIKRIAMDEFGWDGEKNLKSRKFLSDLKDLLTQWKDIPYQKIKEELEIYYASEQFRGEGYVIFIHCREPKEIQRFKDEYNALTLLVHREEAENSETSCDSDSNVLNYNYDITITNTKNLDYLKEAAKNFMILLQKGELDIFMGKSPFSEAVKPI